VAVPAEWKRTAFVSDHFASKGIRVVREPRGALMSPKRVRATTSALMAAMLLAGHSPSSQAARLGNLTYTAAELEHPISLFNVRTNMPNGPGGVDTVMVLHGYLIVFGTYDSGKGGAALHVYDVSNPRNPLLVRTYTSVLTARMAEWHMAGMAKVDGKDIVCVRTTTGIGFFDLTDAVNPKDLSTLDLPGVSGGDYTNASWMNSWSWPYVYTATSGAGVSITDATDPSAPRLVRQVPIGKMGNFRVGPIAVAGNALIVTNMDQAPFRVSVLDLSTPTDPALVDTISGPNGVYSATVIGDLVFGAGDNARYTFVKWAPGGTRIIANKTFASDKGGYCTYQDGYAFCGQSRDGFRKLDLRDLTNIREVGHGVLSRTEAPNGDFDFATVLGNLVFQGNDHGTGNGLLVHQTAPDTTPPTVVGIYPKDNSTSVSLLTHVTVFFSDEIDIDSVAESSVVVRTVGGPPVAGVFSHSSTNAISFGPRKPLEPNRQYEVVVVAGGVRDLVGNAITAQVVSRFFTGASRGVGTVGTGPTPGSADVSTAQAFWSPSDTQASPGHQLAFPIGCSSGALLAFGLWLLAVSIRNARRGIQRP
jgi:hypothetical protein